MSVSLFCVRRYLGGAGLERFVVEKTSHMVRKTPPYWLKMWGKKIVK